MADGCGGSGGGQEEAGAEGGVGGGRGGRGEEEGLDDCDEGKEDEGDLEGEVGRGEKSGWWKVWWEPVGRVSFGGVETSKAGEKRAATEGALVLRVCGFVSCSECNVSWWAEVGS